MTLNDFLYLMIGIGLGGLFLLSLTKFLDHIKSAKKTIDRESLVLSLCLHTAGLGLEKGQSVEFAPIKGTCGTFKLTGSSLPVFKYLVFDKPIMEFIEVTVEVSRPNRIEFISHISSSDEKTNGKLVETKHKFEQPFWILAGHLFTYFPFARDGGKIQHVSTGKVEVLQV